MGRKIPVKLRNEPLIEAVWELRFRPKESSAGEHLLAMLYKEFWRSYPKIVRLPMADIPSCVREQDSKLKYLPKIRLMGENRAIQIGDFVVSLSNRRPYMGWRDFSQAIQQLVGLLHQSELIAIGERISLKYVDLLEMDVPPSLARLDLELTMAGERIQTAPVHLWTKIEDQEGIVHIVEISCPAELRFPENPSSRCGVLLDIDSVKRLPENKPWQEEVQRALNPLHEASKRIFFHLLTSETIEALGPIYEE